MTIKNSVSFTYDGVNSDKYKIINVSHDASFPEEIFMAERDVEMIQIAGRYEPYFIKSKSLPLQIDLQFAFKEGFGTDREHIRNVSKWLFKDYYKPLIFSDMPDKIYYCMYEGDMDLLHNCRDEGLIELVMSNIDPYARSQFMETIWFEPEDEIVIDNMGDIAVPPIVYIEAMDDDMDFILYNQTNETRVRFNNLTLGDEIELDLHYGTVEASNGDVDVSRYENLKIDTLKLDIGTNKLWVVQDDGWKVKLKYQFKYL